MKWLAAAGRELAGLFVEDVDLAIAVLAWVGIVAYLLRERFFSDPFRPTILLAGLLVILVENVLRAARKRGG